MGNNNKHKEARDRRRADGKCLQCIQLAIIGRSYCMKHLIAIKKANARRAERRRKNKLCVQCGRKSYGRELCTIHRSKNNHIRAAQRKERMAKGLCIFCNQTIVKGYASCQKHLDYNRKHRHTTGRFAGAKSTAKHRKLSWGIKREDYFNLIHLPCFYCGMENDTKAGTGLDRKDNTKGYELDNVVGCCGACNIIRGDRFSIEEMKLLGETVRKIKQNRVINLRPD
jgi:hypothetical protein